MKNQNINTANQKAEFIDIKGAKNPFYQPMAGKITLSSENKIASKDDPTKDEVKSAEKFQTAKAEPSKLLGEDINGGPTNAPAMDGGKEGAVKATLNLEGTLKLVEELHRRMVQRGRLVHTIDNLDKFEIEQKEEAEDTTCNYYQGCEIEISDDKRNKFSTKNPVIIKAVAMFVRDLCTSRLAEIEAEITIPE